MAIAFVSATAYTSSVTQRVHTFSHSVPSGTNRLLLIGIQCWGDDYAYQVTFAGVQVNPILKVFPNSKNKPTVEIWGMIAPPEVTGDVGISLQGAGTNYVCAAALNYTGVDQLGPIGAGASASAATGTTCSCNLTTLAANSLIVGVKGGYGGDTYPHSPGSGLTERVDVQSGTSTTTDGGFCIAELPAPTATAYTWSVTQNADDDWAVVVVEVMEAGKGIPDQRRVTQVLTETDVLRRVPVRTTQTMAEVDLGIRVPVYVTQVLLEVDVEESLVKPFFAPPPAAITGFFLERVLDDGA